MSCCVEGCVGDTEEDLTFFQFPLSRPLKRKWVDAIHTSAKITSNSVICSRHFTDDDYECVRGKRRLRSQVVPSVFTSEPTDNSEDKDKELVDKNDNSDTESCPTDKNGEDNNSDDEKTHGTHKNGEENRVVDDKSPVADENGEEKQDDRNGEDEDLNSLVSNTNDEESVISNKNARIDGKTQMDTDKNSDENDDPKNVVNDGDNNVDEDDDGILNNSHSTEENLDNLGYKSDEDALCPLPSEIVSVVYDGIRPYGTPELSNDDIQEKCVESLPLKEILEDNTKTIEPNKHDIEDIIANYHIKQDLKNKRDILHNTNKQNDEEEEKEKEKKEDGADKTKEKEPATVPVEDKDIVNLCDNDDTTLDDTEGFVDCDGVVREAKEPVFIEVSVDIGGKSPERGDCMMLLEDVQVEVDPGALLAAHDDTPDADHRKEVEISLLTSSDEDEVIIQEPNIDTVEVSDATDEDDVPLVRLARPTPKHQSGNPFNRAENHIPALMWGKYEYYCMQCHFRTMRNSEFNRHMAQHSKTLHVCQLCDYTTGSKSQFAKHKRKHKEERRFKCLLCAYKARHKMSLIYHMKSHMGKDYNKTKTGYKCTKCMHTSQMKSEMIEHICSKHRIDTNRFKCMLCDFETSKGIMLSQHMDSNHRAVLGEDSVSKRYKCDFCLYKTSRRSDLKRHIQRKHSDETDDSG